MAVQRAKFQTKRCPMYDPACAAKVTEHVARFYSPGFDVATLIEQCCGRYTRGQHKGQLRGWAEIQVTTEGGWYHRSDTGRGGVAYPGTVVRVTITDFNGKVYLEAR